MSLIVVADDFGVNRSRTDGIVDAVQVGSITFVSLVVNGEDSQRAAETAVKLGIPVGLHLNLTEGQCCSSKTMSILTSKDRWFWGKQAALELLSVASLQLRGEIVDEVRAQVLLFRHLVNWNGPMHIDGHHHVHVLPAVRKVLEVLAEELQLRTVRIPWDPTVEVDSLLSTVPVHSFFSSSQYCFGLPFYKRICSLAKQWRDSSSPLSSIAQYFLGFDLMGKDCSKERIMLKWDALRHYHQAAGSSCPFTVEVMTHVGNTFKGDPSDQFWHCPFSCSPDRQHEKEVWISLAPFVKNLVSSNLAVSHL